MADGVNTIKARLCLRGDQEKAEFRTDSPTVRKSSINLFFMLAAKNKWKIKTSDVKCEVKELEIKIPSAIEKSNGPEYSKSNTIMCNICHLCFTTKVKLKIHLKSIHETTKRFKCNICNASYTTGDHLNAHFVSFHEGKKPNTTKQKLINHIGSVHEGKKPFKCTICFKSFTQTSSLNVHVRTLHENRKPFKCEICDKGFGQNSILKKHILSVHVEKKPYYSVTL